MKKTFGIAILLLTSVFLFSCAAQTDTVEPAGTDANGVAYFEWDGQTEKPWIAFRFEKGGSAVTYWQNIKMDNVRKNAKVYDSTEAFLAEPNKSSISRIGDGIYFFSYQFFQLFLHLAEDFPLLFTGFRGMGFIHQGPFFFPI